MLKELSFSRRSSLSQILFALCLSTALPAMASTLVVADPLESATWTATGGSNFTSRVNGLTPSAGATFWGSSYHLTGNVGVNKTFTGVIVQPGTYTLTIDTSAPDGPSVFSTGYSPVPLSSFTQFGLTGLTAPRIVISAPTPPQATPSWTTWQFRYTIPLDSPDVGHTLGFNAKVLATNYSVMLDNVRVEYQAPPVPLPAGIWGGSALLTVYVTARQLSCRRVA